MTFSKAAAMFGILVTEVVDKRLTRSMDLNPYLSLADAAERELSERPNWYSQTPEGEYLCYIIAQNRSPHE